MHQSQTEGPVSANRGVTGDAESLLRLPSVLRTVQMGRSAWLDLVKDGAAPQPVKIGRATFWVHSELQSFIAERIRLSRND